LDYESGWQVADQMLYPRREFDHPAEDAGWSIERAEVRVVAA